MHFKCMVEITLVYQCWDYIERLSRTSSRVKALAGIQFIVLSCVVPLKCMIGTTWSLFAQDRLTCKVDVAGALEWPRLRPLASARSPWHCLFFLFFLFMLCFSFSSPVGETKYMIGLLIQNWFCQWGSTSVLVKNNIIFSWQSENRDEHMH